MNLAAFERASARRDDPAWLAAAAARSDARVLPLSGARSLVGVEAGGGLRAQFIQPDACAAAAMPGLVWLGLHDGAPLFAADLPTQIETPCEFSGCDWQELRRALPLLPAGDFELLAYARAMIHWHRTHRHCGACGTATVSQRGGHERACPACALVAYPRTDPAVIVIVADGQRCLMGRQAQWDAGRYSAIAGFVEPGESLEAAVAREVREETGVEIRMPPRYYACQPWPFPTSLMVGFHAEPLPGAKVHLDGLELEDARWFTRTDIVAGITSGTLKLATRQSISWRLLEAWFDHGGLSLAGVPGA